MKSTKKTASFWLDQGAQDWASGTKSASSYVNDLIHRARSEYLDAHDYLQEAFSRPAIMAVMDVLSGHLFTPGMSASQEIILSLDDSESLDDVRQKWCISDDEWCNLIAMDDGAAQAFRVVAREFWAGREL